jgi:hypothetical protein
VTPRRILLAAGLVFLLYAYPGYMTVDSADQLVDSRWGSFTDWHSPVMTEVWRRVGFAVSGPAGMLLLQAGLFLAGTHTLLARALPARLAALATAGVFLFPPVMASLAVIWPESQMTAFLTAALACVTSPRAWVRALGLALCVIGAGMRDGGALAILPVIVLGFRWRPDAGWRRWAIAVAAWLAVAGAAAGLERVLVDRVTHRPQLVLAELDVVGVLARAGDLSDEQIQHTAPGVAFVTPDIQGRARRAYPHLARFASGDDRVFDAPEDPRAIDAMLAARWRLARAFPSAYAAHRGSRFVRVLGFRRGASFRPVYTWFNEAHELNQPTMHAARHSPVQKALVYPMKWLGATFLFLPLLYLAVAIGGLIAAAIRRRTTAAILFAAAVAHELSLLVVTTEARFRDSIPMVAFTVLGAVAIAVRAPPAAAQK